MARGANGFSAGALPLWVKVFFGFSVLVFLSAAPKVAAQGSILFPPIDCTAPPNDHFAEAEVISGAPVEVSGTAYCSTDEPGEAPGRSVWYRWTAPGDGLVRIYCSSSGLKVFTGTAILQLAPVELEPESSGFAKFSAQRGVEYRIRVIHSGLYFPDTFRLQLRFDELSIDLMSEGEFEAGKAAYVRVAPPETSLTITGVEAWAGTNSLGIITVPPYDFSYTPEMNGKVAFTARAETEEGVTLESKIREALFLPTNDNFVDAIELPEVIHRAIYANTIGAGFEPGEPAHDEEAAPVAAAFASPIAGSSFTLPIYTTGTLTPAGSWTGSRGSLWWKWTPRAAIETQVTSGSGKVFIYRGDALEDLQFVARATPLMFTSRAWDDASYGGGVQDTSARFTPEPGTTYWFAFVAEARLEGTEWSIRQPRHRVQVESSSASLGEPYRMSIIELQEATALRNLRLTVKQQIVVDQFNHQPVYDWITRSETHFVFSPETEFSWTPEFPGTFSLIVGAAYGPGDYWSTNITVTVSEPRVYAAREDDFSMAVNLPDGIAGEEFEFQTETATTEDEEPGITGGAAERTVWWRWSPSSNQSVRFKAVSNQGGLPVEVFTGTALTNLTRVAHNDGRTLIPGIEGVVPLAASGGATYFIRVSDPRPSTSPHPLVPLPKRTGLQLAVERGDLPAAGLILLGTAGGTQRPDGSIDWEVYARLLDVDGSVLTSSDYTFQFYVGTNLANLKAYTPNGSMEPLGSPSVDNGTQNGAALAGTVTVGFATFSSIRSGQEALVQIRAWNRLRGSTYEAARANGSPTARSEVFPVLMGSELTALATLEGMQDFQMTAAIADFSPGVLRARGFENRWPVWELEASPGFIHAIESFGPSGSWYLITTITNATGTATFTDRTAWRARSKMYRARMLD